MSINVRDIKIINKAIPPTTPGHNQQQQFFGKPNIHGSSKSLNLIVGYKTTPQYHLKAVDTLSQKDVYNLTSYTGELNYINTNNQQKQQQQHNNQHGSHPDIQSLYSHNEEHSINKTFLPSRQNSIVCAQNPRFSTYTYPQNVILHSASSEMEKHESKEIPHYGKLAWFACIFFFPLGLFALKKHYETRKFRYHMPDKAHAAADVTRFFGTFAILMGIVLYALVVVIRLRIAYENGDDFI